MASGDLALRELANHVYIPLADALSWIAFGQVRDSNEWDFTDEQGGVGLIESAWLRLRGAVEARKVEVRGRYTETYSPRQASLADVSLLNGEVLAAFSQFDLATGGIRRKPLGSPDIIWPDHEQALDREWDSFVGDPRAADGYLLVEVKRDDLLNSFSVGTGDNDPKGNPPANRQLDHGAIIQRAQTMRSNQPGISKGSAAASIVAELPRNPKTGNPRDQRGIEKIIAHLWGGGKPTFP